MNKFLCIFSLFIMTSPLIAMRADDATEEISAKEVADIHYRIFLDNSVYKNLWKEEANPCVQAYMKRKIAERYQILGDVITNDEFKAGFFEVMPKVITRSKSTELYALYHFLKRTGFVRNLYEVKYINFVKSPDLVESFPQIYEMALEAMNVQTMAELTKLCISEPRLNTYFYPSPNFVNHNNLTSENPGFFLRKNSPMNIDDVSPHLHWFFESNEETKKLANDVLANAQRANTRINAIRNFLQELTNRSARAKVSELLRSDLVPDAYKKIIAKIADPKVAIAKVSKDIEADRFTALHRIIGLKQINHSRVDLLMLYAFYLFEESEKLSANANELQTIINLLDGEIYGAAEILQPIAHDVLTKLGFQLSTHTPQNNVEAEPAQEEEGTTSEDKPLPEDNPLPTNKKLPSSKKAPLCSVRDTECPNKKYLTLTREHRRLDTLARLVANEIHYDAARPDAGTIALALVDINGVDHLVITQKRRTQPIHLINALKDVLTVSRDYFAQLHDVEDKLIQLQKKAREVKERLLTSDDDRALIKAFYETRLAIDRIKFMKMISSTHKPGTIQARLSNLFGNGNGIGDSRVTVLENLYSQHPEINVADYVIKNGMHLDATPESNNKYQYIGLSMLNCGMCDAMLRGNFGLRGINESNARITIFTRGHYNYGYPHYSFPNRCCQINNLRPVEIRSVLNDNVLLPNETTKKTHLTAIQNADISDSDSDDDL